MAEESWHSARLIPTSGIGGADEQERRATSALLAVLPIVKDFASAVLKPFGAPSGAMETFIEVPFELGEQRLYPDGLIRVTRGAKTWVALVEVKTQDNALQTQQVENYLDIAKEQGFDALITISNEIASHPGAHPVTVKKQKLAKVALHHISWTQLLSEAVKQHEHRKIADPEQSWILGELIRYLEHPKSGALEFADMGPHWTTTRDSVQRGTFRAANKGATEVAARWDQLIQFVSLMQGRRLGVEVQPVLSKAELADPALRVQGLVTSLADRALLESEIRVPGAVAPIAVQADLKSGRLHCYFDVDAPKDGKGPTRVNWLLRQLKDAPEDVRVDCVAAHARGRTTSALLKDVRLDPKVLVADATKELKSFRVALSAPMGSKRSGKGSFVDSVATLVEGFYGHVVQPMKPWQGQAPRPRPDAVVEAALAPPIEEASPALSSQDGPIDPASPLIELAEEVEAEASETTKSTDEGSPKGQQEASDDWRPDTSEAAARFAHFLHR